MDQPTDQPITDQEEPVDETLEEDCSEGPGMTDFPAAIEALLKNPPLLPNESQTDFDRVYDDFLDPLAPETVPQHWLVWNSAMLTWEVMRYRRMKVSYMLNQRRAAVGALIRQAFHSTSMRAVRKGGSDIDDNIERYFSDPAYRPVVGQTLEQAGYSADAAEAEAFARSLNGLSQFERLIASAEKRLMLFFREMDRIHGDRAIRAQNIANNALA